MRPTDHALRQALKRIGAATSRTLVRTARSGRVVALCYHSVHPRAGYASASPDMFERHLAWLAEACDVIPLRSVVEEARDRTRARPAVAITFDDGYADNYEFAFPLLAKYSMTATFFMTVGLSEGDPAVHRRFEALRGVSRGEISALTWQQAREMRAAGLDIGAHTYSHPNLIRLAKDDVARELRVSKEILEQRLDAPVDLMAYPFGKPGRQFDRTTAAIANEVGYSYAAAVLFRAVKPTDSSYALPRFFTTGDTVAALAAKIRGDWDYLGAWQEYAPRALARLVSPQDFRF